MAEKISVLISEEEVAKRIREIAEQISKDYEGKQVHMICILKGGVFFMTELSKHVTVPCSLDFMAISSYGDETVSSGRMKFSKDLDNSIEGKDVDEPLAGKDVIIVEDIIDSGNTLHYLTGMLQQRKPNSIRLCTLLDKPSRREVEVSVDYTGFTIPDAFVVGYGLDYQQRYRNLPYIGVVEL